MKGLVYSGESVGFGIRLDFVLLFSSYVILGSLFNFVY